MTKHKQRKRSNPKGGKKAAKKKAKPDIQDHDSDRDMRPLIHFTEDGRIGVEIDGVTSFTPVSEMRGSENFVSNIRLLEEIRLIHDQLDNIIKAVDELGKR